MQSRTTVGTSSACRQPVGPMRPGASIYSGILDLPESVQGAPQRDFHLDTFFNPVWMLGPNVFSFAKDGTVVLPEQRCMASSSRSRSRVVLYSGHELDKSWKSVAVTEQDDARSAAVLEEEVIRVRAEEKSKLVGRVYKWPQPDRRNECARPAGRQPTVGLDLGVGGTGGGRGRATKECIVPALSRSSSKLCVSRVALRQARWWEERKGLRDPKVPRSEELVLEDCDNRVLWPAMTEEWVEDELTVKIKKVLRM